jgi:phage tail-like protein
MSDFNPFNSTIALSHRFGVYFLESGIIPTGIDVRFQRVSGIAAEIETENIYEGGVLYPRRVPKRVRYPNLVLERGVFTGVSPLSFSVSFALSSMSLNPSNILIILFDEHERHVMHRVIRNAIPVKWVLGDMDADSDKVMVERIEFAYEKMLTVPFAFSGYNLVKDAIDGRL